ncbi:MAG: TetR/AcrR family transcriptional regulator [Candidatus Latescibacteria bacterium]|nr:TetR/AcrR family transcriptional regulator [Candidatus Latescibacterota bacterium]
MRPSRREEIIAATIQLVAQKGVKAATIRQITTEAGVTEGALYRHFTSKEDLCQQVYERIVAEMAAAKKQMAAGPLPLRDKLREWVRLSYEYFDRYPEAFTYVLLTAHSFAADDISTSQGRLLMQLFQKEKGDDTTPEMALCLFSGVLLNVPRMINEGQFKGPASQYTEEVTKAIWRIFRLE